MTEQFQKHINAHLSFLKDFKLLIAVSGGLDSVVLTHLCHKLKFNIALAHCNFNLRGEESDADEAFVRQLAKDLEVEVFVKNFETETYAQEHQLSIQMAARKLRYEWFLNLVAQLRFDYLLTAHHADDNLETFLINLSRGTGLEGLTGIPQVNGCIVRPLLPFSRQDLEAYAEKHKLKWREDSSNAATKYLRNKLRHDVIPALKEINPQLLQNFIKTQAFLNDSNEIIEASVARIKKNVVKVEDGTVKFDIEKLQELSNPKAYLYRLLKDFNFTEWDDVKGLLSAQSGKQVLSQTHRLVKDRDYLLLTELGAEQHKEITITNADSPVETPFGILYFNEAKAIGGKADNVIFVDKEKLKFPLTIRKWQEGDFFYPFGMQGKKKLSKFFKDEKFSLLDKENALLLCSGNDIVWIINKRADDRFKVTAHTSQILKIELK